VAGADLVAAVDASLLLDGRGSSDPDGDALAFSWTVVAAPAGATFELEAPGEALTVFVPGAPGEFLVRLRVEDGRGGEALDLLRVRATGGCGADEECDDGVECTEDRCLQGACSHTPRDAACPGDDLFCTGVARCDPLAGCVESGDPCAPGGLSCDEDADVCTGCIQDDDCDDLDPCTVDFCLPGGTCERQPLRCDDQVDCTDDRCVDGVCEFVPDDAQCPDDGQFCNGPERCDPVSGCVSQGDPCEVEGRECQATCDPVLDACADPAGTPCGDQAEVAPCDLPDHCDGLGACDPRLAGSEVACPDLSPFDCWRAGCDGQGGCAQQAGFEAPEYVCRASLGDCDPAETCGAAAVGGACPADQRMLDGVPCAGLDAEMCNSTCRAGVCSEADPAADGAACDGGAGVCCAQVCQLGWSCCGPGECDDQNPCTDDGCDAGQCQHACPDPNCLVLTAPAAGSIAGPTGMSLSLCDAGLSSGSFTCFSSRNGEAMIDEDFEADFGVFSTNGADLSRRAEAQSPFSPGSMGVAVCGNDAWVSVDVDTTGRQDLLLRFSLANHDTDNNELLSVIYRDCPACEWRSLGLVGDNLDQPYRELAWLLPPSAEGQAEARLGVILNPASGGDCVFLDDAQLVDLPARLLAEVLVEEDFEDGTLGIFTRAGGDPDDVQIVDDGSRVVQLKDHKDASIVAHIDTQGRDPQAPLVARWSWRQIPADPMEDGDYVFLELSTDGGATWQQLAGTGHRYRPTAFTAARAILPCEAYGLADLQLRFIAPSSAGNANGEGIRVDDFALEAWTLDWVDAFGPVVDQGGGRYGLTVTTSQPGTASLWCRQGCGGGALWSNPVSVQFQ